MNDNSYVAALRTDYMKKAVIARFLVIGRLVHDENSCFSGDVNVWNRIRSEVAHKTECFDDVRFETVLLRAINDQCQRSTSHLDFYRSWKQYELSHCYWRGSVEMYVPDFTPKPKSD